MGRSTSRSASPPSRRTMRCPVAGGPARLRACHHSFERWARSPWRSARTLHACPPSPPGRRHRARRRAAHPPGERRDPPLLPLRPGRRAPRPAGAVVLVFHGGGGRATASRRTPGSAGSPSGRGSSSRIPQGLNGRWNDGRGFAARRTTTWASCARCSTRSAASSASTRAGSTRPGSRTAPCSPTGWRATSPGTLAAVAPVAGAMPADLAPACERHGAGQRDRVSGNGGSAHALRRRRRRAAAGAGALGGAEHRASGRTAAGAPAAPVTTDEPDRVADGTRVRRTVYGGCREGREVELYTIEGGGHTWPGGPAAAARWDG